MRRSWLRRPACLRLAIHAFANFEINCVVVEEGSEVVGSNGLGWDLRALDADVFVA